MAAALGLGIDESYMVVAGRGPLQLGYFDHPLISWWMVRTMADATGSEASWIVRLPFIVMFAGSTWLMAKLTATIFTPRAGLWAAIALNLSPVFTLSTGGWVLPDGPLTFFLLAASLCLVNALPGRGWLWWLGAGLCAGLAMLSKYTAMLTLGGAVIYLLTQKQHRAWLTRPQPYAAALVALAVFSPVILWNLENHWASLAFQGGRAAPARLDLFGPVRTALGEAVFVLPWIWASLLWAGWRAVRQGQSVWRGWLLVCLAAPPILLFVIVSLWSRNVLFHWAAPGYLMLFPLFGAWLAEHATWGNHALARSARWTAGILASLAAIAVLVVWIDPANGVEQARDWTGLRGQLAARNLLGTPVAATSWSEAGKIGIGLGPSEPIYCLNVDAREFRFSPSPPHAPTLLIISTRRTYDQIESAYGGYFGSIEELPPLDLFEHVQLHLYLGHDQKGWP
jgi:4-amino-4-deoxy-L-arabinose transferase-like glycosyltransferase